MIFGSLNLNWILNITPYLQVRHWHQWDREVDQQPPSLQTVRTCGTDHLRGNHGPRGGQEEALGRKDPGILLLNVVMKPSYTETTICIPCFSVKPYNSFEETQSCFRSSSRIKSPTWVTITFGSPAPESMDRDQGTVAAAATATVSSGQWMRMFVWNMPIIVKLRSRSGDGRLKVRWGSDLDRSYNYFWFSPLPTFHLGRLSLIHEWLGVVSAEVNEDYMTFDIWSWHWCESSLFL